MNSNIYFISDLHFGHDRLAKKRGFVNALEQDDFIVGNWNKIVRKKDVVWILGDITMEKQKFIHYLDRLTGIKKIVLGNHDLPQHTKDYMNYANWVCGSFKFKKKYILTHIPIHKNESKLWELNIHGHVHENTINHPKYFNVSVDVLNYTPISFEEIINQTEIK